MAAFQDGFEPAPRGAAVVREVGLRDGLQSVARVVPTEVKLAWLRALHRAGLREIEVGSFVPARLLPQMADTAQVLEAARALPGLRASVLVPNLKGAELALAHEASQLIVPLSASHAHSLANLRRTPDEVVAEVGRIRAARDAAGVRTVIEGGVGTAFGCTLQGRVDPEEVLRLMQALLDAGADCVSLADTVGLADPASVRELFTAARAIAGDRLHAGHFHDTRGLALANVLAALDCGVTRHDASFAGLGGCPYAPGASGNAASEDLAFMLARMGYDTGLDLDAMLALRAEVARELAGESLGGTLWRAGLPKAASRPAPVPPRTASARPQASSSSRAAALPLAGVRVVEFTHMVMGPTCGMVLADLGAEVIKIEPVEGDRTRHLLGAGAGFFPMFNRNKKSVALDLRSPDGAEAARRLAASADVVAENFKPGTMAKYGLDYASLSAANPGLVYVSLKGFLPGPYEHRTALDEVVQMMGGLAYMTGRPGDPLRAGTSVNDIMGGMFGAIGAMAALMQRRRTGRGQEVQSSLFENNVFLVGQHMLQYAITGVAAAPMPDRISAWALYDVFSVRDGQIFLAAVSDAQWRVFCDAFGFDDLKQAPHLATNNDRVVHRPTLLADLRQRLAGHDVATLAQIFERHGLPFAPIVRPEDLYDDPHLRATGGLAEVRLPDGARAGEVARAALFPLMMDGARLGVRQDPPTLGADTDAVLRGLGYPAAELARLRAAGALA